VSGASEPVLYMGPLLSALPQELSRLVLSVQRAKDHPVPRWMRLRTVSSLGGWAPDARGEVSDARVQELIYPEMIQRRPKWLVSDREQV